jgi:hypothetical protein
LIHKKIHTDFPGIEHRPPAISPKLTARNMERPTKFLQKHYGKNIKDQRQLIMEISAPMFKLVGTAIPEVCGTGRKCVKVYMKQLY